MARLKLPFDAAPNDVILNEAIISKNFDEGLTFGVARQLFVKEKIFQCPLQRIGILGLLECRSVPRNGVGQVAGEVVGRDFAPFFVNDAEIKGVHNFLEAVECFGVDFTNFSRGRWSVTSVNFQPLR